MTTLRTQYNEYISSTNSSISIDEFMKYIWPKKFNPLNNLIDTVNKFNKVSYGSDSEDIRIFIDDILHIRIPRDNNIKIHARSSSGTKLYYIDIWCMNHTVTYEYEDKNLWKDILQSLNKVI